MSSATAPRCPLCGGAHENPDSELRNGFTYLLGLDARLAACVAHLARRITDLGAAHRCTTPGDTRWPLT